MLRETLVCAAVALIGLSQSWADTSDTKTSPATAAASLDFFTAIDDGRLDVQFIPLDAADANILIENKTGKPLHVRLPRAFAAVPLLAQLGPGIGPGIGPGGGGPVGGGGGGANAQSVGGAVNGGGNQGLGNPGMANGAGAGQGRGFGFGMMRIPPHETRRLTAKTVCLEFGKPEPRPKIAYRMIPIDEFSKDLRLANLCARLASDDIDQNIIQAAAWHLASDIDWQQLSELNRMESKYRGNLPYFTESELKSARKLVAQEPSDSYQ